ncbi:aldo/keto reductase, partial [Oscillospiraceae bacterium OttesenSCG-928-F05]|nr:aldo/keto reductase [Oscillospiraceae bacterium OttesenSCG-928-F05]
MGKLGNITEKIPLLGLGAMRLPTNSADVTDIDFDQVFKMVDTYLENGFTYFDTAYNYHGGKSEGAVKKALVERYPREAFLLADKMPAFMITKTEQFEPIFQEQLARCGVEYFDFYMLHSLGKEKIEEMERIGGFDYLKKLKAEGKIRYMGFSFHDEPEVLIEAIDRHPELDFVQLQINYVDWEFQRAEVMYKACRERNLPIVIMEPVKGGALAGFPEA